MSESRHNDRKNHAWSSGTLFWPPSFRWHLTFTLSRHIITCTFDSDPTSETSLSSPSSFHKQSTWVALTWCKTFLHYKKMIFQTFLKTIKILYYYTYNIVNLISLRLPPQRTEQINYILSLSEDYRSSFHLEMNI